MSKRFRVYLDSGANIHSKYEQEISLDDLGITDEEWDEMDDDEQTEVMKDIAWERVEWGFEEIN